MSILKFLKKVLFMSGFFSASQDREAMNDITSVTPEQCEEKQRLLKLMYPKAKTIAILKHGSSYVSPDTVSREKILQELSGTPRLLIGTDSADFTVSAASMPQPIWIVQSAIENMVNIYTEWDAATPDYVVGLIGRNDCGKDVESPEIILYTVVTDV